MTTSMSLAASVYAEKYQFSVFPCRARGKEPLTAHGCKDAVHDQHQIKAWWDQWPQANVAIACGPASNNLFVLDIDGDEGRETLRLLESKSGSLPKTPMVLTGRGEQYYFHTQTAFKNRVSIAPGIDVRAAGGYVIAPPSIHPNGRQYAWEVSARIDEVPVAAIPDWLSLLLSGAESEKSSREQLLKNAAIGVKCGTRNETLASVAGYQLRLGKRPELDYALLWAWNRTFLEQPLSKEEFDRTVNSIAMAEHSRRTGRTPC